MIIEDKNMPQDVKKQSWTFSSMYNEISTLNPVIFPLLMLVKIEEFLNTMLDYTIIEVWKKLVQRFPLMQMCIKSGKY